ncbi:hypothetical protein [Arthrobacter nitrophenolicus]|uniref:Uncharacterized protein n=1 Tax=Arthrobacter nitrophenolicus TaxID=683150 RepID=A0A4R5XR24_9MICC|nr:hypothetical protein [Arthrobacter nitrophenolicus]TDL34039.1 hypothetical protein E2R57_16150 [Arthrobacter nitrophenolicus]
MTAVRAVSLKGYSHRIAARALADDRYITITGKGPTWTAKITQLGVELLKSIDDSDSNSHTHESEADKFIQKLTAADGVLEVEGGYRHAAVNDALIRGVMKSALRPKGYKLEITSVGSWQSPKYEARWARHFPDDVDERPVPIPDTVGKYHPVAKVFRDGTRGVSKVHVSRAAKLLHALATESTARGYEVTLPSSHKRTNSRGTTTLDGDIAITIGTTTVPLEMRELPPNGGSARPYIPKYNSRSQSWTLVHNTDFVSTGRLQLELTQRYSTNGRRERFRDGKRQQLDSALPSILREIEIQHLENEWKREQAGLKEEETQRRWEAAMKRARIRIQDHHKAEQLKMQADAWSEASMLRKYVDALETRLGSEPDIELVNRGLAWLTWARDYIDTKDPLLQPIKIPVLGNYRDEDLVPFLDACSPHGPHGRT